MQFLKPHSHPEPNGPPRDAPADLRPQRVRQELTLQDHQRTVARLQGLPQEATVRVHVLHPSGDTHLTQLGHLTPEIIQSLSFSGHTCPSEVSGIR